MKTILKSTIAALISFSVLQSCTNAPKSNADLRAKECQDRLTKAEDMIAKEKFLRAREILDPIINDCSGSGVTEKAMYLLGEADFGLEDWISARSDYGIYLGQYPNSEYSNLAAFRKALSSYKMPYRKGRDGSYTQNAIDDFESFLYRYPNSTKVDSAQLLIAELHERLASDLHDVAKLYLKMGEPGAAVMTLKDFMDRHGDSRLVPLALEDMIGAYIRLDQYSQARLYVDSLKSRLDSNSKIPQELSIKIDQAEKKFNARIKDEDELTLKKKSQS